MTREWRAEWIYSGLWWLLVGVVRLVWWLAVTDTRRLEWVAPGLSVLFWGGLSGLCVWCRWGLSAQRSLFRGGEDVSAFSPAGGRSAWLPAAGLTRGLQGGKALVSACGVVGGLLIVPGLIVGVAVLPVLPAVAGVWVWGRVRRARREVWW